MIKNYIKPYSKNIIFFDAEFTSFDLKNGEFISIGMINYDGTKQLYIELDYNENLVSEWTKENVIPNLKLEKKSKIETKEIIRNFCGHSKPHLMATVNQWDMAFWNKLFENEELPTNRIPLDFASMLFAIGLNPTRTVHNKKQIFYEEFGINLDEYTLHNSLSDAKLMRDLYFKLILKPR